MKWRILIFAPGKKRLLRNAWVEHFHYSTTQDFVETWGKLRSNAPAACTIKVHPLHLGDVK